MVQASPERRRSGAFWPHSIEALEMTPPQNVASQGDATSTSNAGLSTITGALISGSGDGGAYQWGVATGSTFAPLSLSDSFPGASAAWAKVPCYLDPMNEPATYPGLDPHEQAACATSPLAETDS